MADDSEYKNSQRSSFWWSTLVWVGLLLLAYFGADIVDKGNALNELTPYPVLGYVLWVTIALALWFLLLQPIIQFCNLRRAGKESTARQVRRAERVLSGYAREPEESELRKLCEEFAVAPRDFRTPEGEAAWTVRLEHYRKAIGSRARDMILGYCKAAGVGVVFSRNNLLDGLILLAMQIRLVIALSRLFGYKPSPVFNTCCFIWIASNSLVAALTRGAVEDLGEAAAENILDMLMGSDEVANATAEIAATKLGLQITIQVIIEAVMAGAAVYVTGRIFLWKLESEGGKVTLKKLIEWRKEGRRALAGNLFRKTPEAAFRVASQVSSDVMKTTSSIIIRWSGLEKLFSWFRGSKKNQAELPEPEEEAELSDKEANSSSGWSWWPFGRKSPAGEPAAAPEDGADASATKALEPPSR